MLIKIILKINFVKESAFIKLAVVKYCLIFKYRTRKVHVIFPSCFFYFWYIYTTEEKCSIFTTNCMDIFK